MQVGIGAFVVNSKREVLVVQERFGPLKGSVSCTFNKMLFTPQHVYQPASSSMTKGQYKLTGRLHYKSMQKSMLNAAAFVQKWHISLSRARDTSHESKRGLHL